MKNVPQARTRGRRFLRFLLTGASLLLVLMIFLILWSRGSVVVTRNVDYLAGTDYAEDKDKLDILMPRGVSGVPVIVFFHGGALQRGDKRHGEALASRIVPEGVGVVSANYRLSPSVMHPAHIQDAAAAFAWVIENIARYGGDPECVYVSGHSAGAYLATLMAIDPVHLAAHGLGLEAIRGTIAISPFLYVEETAKNRSKTVWGEDPAAWLRASVTPHIGPGRGSMLLIYADGDADWRRDQIDSFGKAMRAAGNRDVHVVEVSNRDHSTLITQMNMTDDQIGGLVLRFIRGWEENAPQE
jgi:acetyl esterase/lipase